jgi:hypothetical protein
VEHGGRTRSHSSIQKEIDIMAGAASISHQQIFAAVQESVEKALQGHSEAFKTTEHTIGFLPEPPNWVGIVYNNASMPQEEAQLLATELAGADGAVAHGRGHVTIGFQLRPHTAPAVVGPTE